MLARHENHTSAGDLVVTWADVRLPGLALPRVLVTRGGGRVEIVTPEKTLDLFQARVYAEGLAAALAEAERRCR